MHEFEEAGKDDEKGRFIRSIIPTFFVANWLEISKQQKNGFRIRILKPLCLQSEAVTKVTALFYAKTMLGFLTPMRKPNDLKIMNL